MLLINGNFITTAQFVNEAKAKVKIAAGDQLEVPPPFATVGTVDVGTGTLNVNGNYEPNLASKPVIVLEIAKPYKTQPKAQHVGMFHVKYTIDATGTTRQLATPHSFKPPLESSYVIASKFERGINGEFTPKNVCLPQDGAGSGMCLPTTCPVFTRVNPRSRSRSRKTSPAASPLVTQASGGRAHSGPLAARPPHGQLLAYSWPASSTK
jgi:hypothetical protein